MNGVPFLSKPVCKRVRVGSGGSLPTPLTGYTGIHMRSKENMQWQNGQFITPNTLLSSKHRIPSDTQDTQKKRLELSTLFFYFLFVNLVCWPLFFSENDHESWFKGSINLFSCFVFPCRSCDNTLVDWTSTFHSNFFLFPCICTHNLWKRQRGKFLLWPSSGKQKLKTSKASICPFPAPHPPQKK